MEFYLHEDDWAMIDLVPEENRVRAADATEEARAFGEAHRAPGGVGWTDMYVTPEMPISFGERGVTLPALRALVPELEPYERVLSGYSSQRDPVPSAFALGGKDGVLYGSLDGDLGGERIVELHVAHPGAPFAPILARLGQAYRLLLIDWSRDAVFLLSDEKALAAYFHDDEE